MLSRLATYFSPPAPPPLPDFQKAWRPARVGHHRLFVDIRNPTDADFYLITEAGAQFQNTKPDSTLTVIPLPRDVLQMPRHMVLHTFFGYIRENGYNYVKEYSKPFDSVTLVDGAEQENNFIVLCVNASKRPLGTILDCLRFENRPPINVFLETHFEGSITSGRFSRYGNYFDLVYETAYLTNLYNMDFDNRVLTTEALVANLNALVGTQEDIVLLRDFPPLVGLQDRVCFYDLVKIYLLTEVAFPRGARRPADERPAYIQFLMNRINATANYFAYLHAFSGTFSVTPVEDVLARITALEALINTKRATVRNYYMKFLLFPTFAHTTEESSTASQIFYDLIKSRLAIAPPTALEFRPFVGNVCMARYLGATYPKISGFKQGAMTFVGFQETEEGDVRLQNGESIPYATLAPHIIPLKATSDIERFYYCFCANVRDFDAFFAKTDDQLRAEFHTSPLYTVNSGTTLGLEIFCQPRKGVLIDTSTNNSVENIRYNTDLHTGSILLDEPVIVNKGALQSWEVGKESGVFYSIIFEWRPNTIGGIFDKQLYLTPQPVVLDRETQSRVHFVPNLYENIQDIILKHIQGDKLRRFFTTDAPYILDTVLNVQIMSTQGDYAVTLDGFRIKKRIVWPDIPKATQLSRFGFFIPGDTVIDLDLTPSKFFTSEQIRAMKNYSISYNLQELVPFFERSDEPFSGNSYFSTTVDVMAKIIEQDSETRFLDDQIRRYVRSWSPEFSRYPEGKKFLLGFHEVDNTLKTLRVRIGFAVPNFNLRVEVYPNRPCFLSHTIFWPARVFAHTESTGITNIKMEFYNQFRNIENVRPLLPPSLVASMRSSGTASEEEDRKFLVERCTTLIERAYPSQLFVSDRPEEYRGLPFSYWYRYCRDQFNNRLPHDRFAFNWRDPITYRFTNASALHTYFAVTGWPRYIPNSGHVFAMGGGARRSQRRKTAKGRKDRRRRTYRRR